MYGRRSHSHSTSNAFKQSTFHRASTVRVLYQIECSFLRPHFSPFTIALRHRRSPTVCPSLPERLFLLNFYRSHIQSWIFAKLCAARNRWRVCVSGLCSTSAPHSFISRTQKMILCALLLLKCVNAVEVAMKQNRAQESMEKKKRKRHTQRIHPAPGRTGHVSRYYRGSLITMVYLSELNAILLRFEGEKDRKRRGE